MTKSNRSASPRVVVEVTQEIIDQAQQRDSSHCMIADAIAAAYPNARKISVDVATCRFSDPTTGKRYAYLTPRHAQIALLDFDQGKPTQPFVMRLQSALVYNMQRAGHREPKGQATITRQRGNSIERSGGEAPPLGPLHAGTGAGSVVGREREASGRFVAIQHESTDKVQTVANDRRTGKRRAFGLRLMQQ